MLLHTVLKALLVLTIIGVPSSLLAAPDQYPGDTSIYGGTTTTIQPNILIILDNSGSMSGSVVASQTVYDPSTVYPSLKKCNYAYCSTNKVYKASDYSEYITDVEKVTTSCGGANPRELLKTTGQYSGRKLTTSGACGSGTSSYVLGNYVNWLKGPSTVYDTKLNIAKNVVKNLIQSTNGVNFGLMKFNTSQGGTFISQSVSGVNYVTTVKNMDDIHVGTTTNRTALINVVNSYTASTWTPLAETMYEALKYYQGSAAKFGTVGLTSGSYTTPIQASCQRNYIILVTDGMSTEDDDPILGSAIGDFDKDKADPGSFDSDGTHYLDDVAKYLYDVDLLPDDSTKPHTLGTQRVTTFTIGFGLGGADADAVNLLARTADTDHGHGQAFLAADQTGLSEALTQVISNILETNSSFVAPVVPVSPENKTSNASRLYIGLFKPGSAGGWSGNLKKFGLDRNNNLLDRNGAFANWVDLDGNGWDDRPPYESLPNGRVNGSFRDTSISYWSSTLDVGEVDAGGAGALLQQRDPATRRIFTYLGNQSLVDSSNAFDVANAGITSTLLGVADAAARDDLVRFVRGYDAYDDNGNGSKTDNRDWIMGDVLHSRPTVVNYASYTFSATSEADCATNKTMIYVGGNDGMLHAFRDCDGTEAWAFVPPDALPNLQYMRSTSHTNYVDSTVAAYVYDAPPADGTSNHVYLLVGQRRGGGTNTVPAKGNYYLIDATDAENPKYISQFSNATAGFTEMAETWSEPKIEKLKIGSGFKIAAIFGGGYDNLNEDSRYGATSQYLGTGGVTYADTGAGQITSSGTSAAFNPKGRGIYIVEIASLAASAQGYVSDFTNSGSLLWSYTNATNAGMTHSIPGEIATVDSKGRGYIDRLYAVDVAGSLWRFNIGAYPSDSTTASWTGLKIFTTNPGSLGATDVGRKAFYKPAVVPDYCYDPVSKKNVTCDMVFYGTGDREHPLNMHVLDRIYMIKAKDIDSTGKTEACVSGETNPSKCLVDVTLNQLQTTEIKNVSVVPGSPTVGSVEYYLNLLNSSGGWYIRLDENQGEKVLATPRVINKMAYFTTYVPTNSDPCQTANPGDNFYYVLNFKTGEAALNLVKTNDAANSSTVITTNTRGQAAGSAVVLTRADRKGLAGQGIASGVVTSTTASGKMDVFLSSGGEIKTLQSGKGSSGKILYWRQK